MSNRQSTILNFFQKPNKNCSSRSENEPLPPQPCTSGTCNTTNENKCTASSSESATLVSQFNNTAVMYHLFHNQVSVVIILGLFISK